MSAMDVATALDHLRSYYTRQVKPFRDLLEVLEVVESASQAYPQAQAELARLQGETEAAKTRLATLTVQISDVEAKAKAATAALDAETARVARAQEAMTRDAAARQATVASEHQALMHRITKEHEELVASQAREIETQRTTLTTLTAEINRLRQRFSG